MFFFGAFAKLRQATISFVMSVCPPVRNGKLEALNGRIFIKFDIYVFFDNLSRKFNFRTKSDKNNAYFT